MIQGLDEKKSELNENDVFWNVEKVLKTLKQMAFNVENSKKGCVAFLISFYNLESKSVPGSITFRRS